MRRPRLLHVDKVCMAVNMLLSIACFQVCFTILLQEMKPFNNYEAEGLYILNVRYIIIMIPMVIIVSV